MGLVLFLLEGSPVEDFVLSFSWKNGESSIALSVFSADCELFAMKTCVYDDEKVWLVS